MKIPMPGSIRGIVAYIVLLALLPSLALLVYSDYRDENGFLDDIDRSASSAAHRVALTQVQTVETTRVLLTALADTNEIKERDSATLDALFASLVQGSSRIVGLRLHAPNGVVLASAGPDGAQLSREEQEHLAQAASLGTFSIFHLPDHEVVYGGPVIHLLQPVRQGEHIDAILTAAVRITVAPGDLDGLAKPHLARALLADANGNVLYELGLPEAAPLRNIAARKQTWTEILKQQSFSGRVKTENGNEIYFEKLFVNEEGVPELTVVLSLVPPSLLGKIQGRMLTNIAFMACAALLPFFLSWLIFTATLRKPLKALFDTAQRIREGDLSARITVRPPARELFLLAESVNGMARALEARSRELVNASENAQSANQVKTSFLATMSHEIRTPMNAILGMTYLARQEDLTEQQRGYIDNIHSQASKLLLIINDILDFSKIEAGKLHLESVPFSPVAVLEDVAETAKEIAAKKGLAFKKNFPPYMPERLLGDSLYLTQILNNILSNAIRYTEKGEVSLTCRVERPSAPGLTLVFAIADTAGGMTGEEKRMLFPEADQEVSPDHYEDGALLNLAVTRKLARLMEGKLTVDTIPGSGSIVTLRIPFFETTEPIPAEASAGAKELPGIDDPTHASLDGEGLENQPLMGIKVLLVEDNPINQQVAEEILQSLGASVRIADNGQTAVDILSSLSEDAPLPVVLMDLQMPVLDGFAATEKLRASRRFANLPVIAMSAHSRGEEWEHCQKVGMNDYIAKPIDVPTLVETVLRWAKQQGAV